MLEINFCLEWDPKQCGHGPGQRGFSQAAGQDSNTVQVGKNHLDFFSQITSLNLFLLSS